jgi:hypothetical protein
VAESLCFDSQSTPLFVREPESTTAELLPQDLVLLAQTLDCLLLLLIHPARDRDQQEPERIENAHPSTVSRVISGRPAIRIVFSASEFLDKKGSSRRERLSHNVPGCHSFAQELCNSTTCEESKLSLLT